MTIKNLKDHWSIKVLLFLATVLLTVIITQALDGVIPRYYRNICIFVGINIIMALGLNLITGVTGQLSLGHAAFMSIGAYASAIATVNYQVPFLLAVLIGGLIAALFGMIIGFPTLRLTGDYLAIATLGFAEIVRVQFTNMEITNGAIGFLGIKPLTTFPIVMTITVITVFFMAWLKESRNGRAMLAIREDEIASASVGINTTLYKIQAFTIGAFCAGIGGGLFAHTTTFIQPTDFGFLKSIDLLCIVVLGGLGSIPGTIISAIVLTSLPELLRSFANYRMIAYGILLVVVMIFRPYGLMGQVNFRHAVRRILPFNKQKGHGLGGAK